MSKKRIVETIQNNGVDYGQISSPNDIIKAQDYAHEHVEQVTNNLLTHPTDVQIAGCYYGITGLSLYLTAAQIYRYGRQYLASDSNVSFAPANATNPRIDLVIATLADSIPAMLEFLPFQRLRTPQEFSDDIAPYPPTQFQRATERHNIASISVKTGVPAANPAAPALAANEVLLYSIRIPAGATAINNSNVTDVRKIVPNLSAIKTQVGTLEDRLREVADALLVLRYRYPVLASGNGRCPADVAKENGKDVIDIPVGTLVQFGDRFVNIYPENFVDQSVNARYAAVSSQSNTYIEIVENSSEFSQAGAGGSVIRFDAPSSTKALYLNRDGQLILRSAVTPSTADECLLIKVTIAANKPPQIKRYYNLRSGMLGYSKVANDSDPDSRKFEYDSAFPVGVGYFTSYGIRASDRSLYELLGLSVGPEQFDGLINVPGVANGDTWIVRLFLLSQL